MLDTCGLLSLSGAAAKKLSGGCLRAIAEADSLYLSSCSCFEIVLKHKRGNLTFPQSLAPMKFWQRCVQHYAISEIPVSATDFAQAVDLPDHHADPFDRIIIAQSFRLKCALVTYDQTFAAYGVETIC